MQPCKEKHLLEKAAVLFPFLPSFLPSIRSFNNIALNQTLTLCLKRLPGAWLMQCLCDRAA